jgi:hypothetical protein
MSVTLLVTAFARDENSHLKERRKTRPKTFS